MKNYKYFLKNGQVFKEEATAKELKDARTESKKIIKKDIDKLAWRSCWVCNGAHKHFLQGKWGKWVLNCFECGHFYFNKIDVTEE